MNGCEPLTLCWVEWNSLWPHFTICLGLAFSLALAYRHEIRRGLKQPLLTIGIYSVFLLVPLIISMITIAVHFEWRQEPTIGEVLRFFANDEALFFIYAFYLLSFVGGLCYLLVQQRSTIFSIFWNNEVRLSKVIAWSFLAYAATLIVNLLAYRVGYASSDESARFINAASGQDSMLIRSLMVLSTSLIEPVAEESYFRGILQPKLVDQFGPAAGILTQSAIFSFLHLGSSGGFIVTLIAGLIFGASFYYSKSLVSPIVSHLANNSLATFMLLTSS